MSRKKSTSTAAPKKGERLILDRIMNTRDPQMKETYFRLFDEEWERSGYTPHTIPIRERALIRYGLVYRHLLSARQQLLLDREARALGLA